MSTCVERDRLWDRAFELAYFIHRDRRIALRLTCQAAEGLAVAASRQQRRRRYRPRGRPGRHRSKVVLGKAQLLQILVLQESESFERHQELLGRSSERELISHFVMHLARITLNRNSFHVAIAICRLLYGYSTKETTRIYDALVQDPERFRDDSYYRARKKTLFDQTRRRFGSLLEVRRGQHGEQSFRSRDDSSRYVSWVAACLRALIPWGTSCLLPRHFDPSADELPPFRDQFGDREEAVELHRIHSLLHLDCFGRLIRALGLDPPEKRLAIPIFAVGQNGHGKPPLGGGREPEDRQSTAGVRLSDTERETIESELRHAAWRRRTTLEPRLLILADGTQIARLDLRREKQVTAYADLDTQRIEVRNPNGHLLALCCPPDMRGGPTRLTSRLEGGQEIRFELSQISCEAQGPRLEVVVSQREFHPVRLLRRLFDRLPRAFRSWPAAATLAALLMLALPWSFWSPDLRPQIQGSNPTSQGRHAPPDTTELLRGAGQEAARALADVRSLYLTPPLEPQRPVFERILQDPRSTPSLALTQRPETADAALKLSPGEARDQWTLNLVNSAGEALWSAQYTGDSWDHAAAELFAAWNAARSTAE